MSEPQWEPVAKARDMREAIPEDDIAAFLEEHGWQQADVNDNARKVVPQLDKGVTVAEMEDRLPTIRRLD